MSVTMPVSSHGTFASFVTRPIVRLLAERGADPDEFLARFGDTRPELLRKDGRVDLAVIARLLDELAPIAAEPAVGDAPPRPSGVVRAPHAAAGVGDQRAVGRRG